MNDSEKSFSLKELLSKYMGIVDHLKEKYDTQSTSTFEKTKENTGDINSIGKKLRKAEDESAKKISDVEKRLSSIEKRVYAATIIIGALWVIVQNYLNK